MGFFTTRERDALGKPPADMPVQGKVRELVRPDVMPRRRPPERSLADQLGSLMQRVADTSVHTIDDLIHDMQQRREELLHESARMQREIIEYARLNQSTMQSTKIISESLAYLHAVPDAPGVSGSQDTEQGTEQDTEEGGDMPAVESRETATAQHGKDEQHGMDDGTPDEGTGAGKVSASPTAEAG
jgi:hypothetical protein